MTVGREGGLPVEGSAGAPSPFRAVRPLKPRDWILAGLRVALMGLTVGYLAFKLHALGWNEVLSSLPASPWFYGLSLLIYLALPVTDLMLYRWLWGIGPGSLPTFLRKQVYNQAVLEYSGEAYFYLWARRQPGLSEQEIFRTVRDVNILSAFASYLFTLVVLLVARSGRYGPLDAATEALLGKAALVIGLLVAGYLAAAALLRRRMTFGLRTSLGVCAIHLARIAIVMLLQALQWHAALRDVGVQVWVFFLAVQLVLTRVPFLPAKDLMFAGVAAGMASRIDAPQAAVLGMFATCAALSLAAHLVVFCAATFGGGFGGRPTPPGSGG